jgi:Tol biopolymer transport system component
MDEDGTNVTRLTTMGAYQAAWSPDGKQIVFVRPGLQSFLYGADADGRNVRLLKTSSVAKFFLCWSPDGATIAFNDDTMSVRANIFQMDLDGKNLRRLSAGPKMDERPAYSPDGAKLAFQSSRDGNYEIYVMNLR